ncbi:MAG: Lrp/AsnC family transcriptional regulator [Dehalococcoidales bacterium]|nr:Lrp/AsnC family transcriptional regulator [Dehalococcoidales bacterium]
MIDEINRKLMIALSKDGRYSYARLARELGIKATTVAKRVDSMMQDDVFTINAIPNPINMGYRVMSVIGLDVELPSVEDVCEKLAEYPNVSYIATTFGRFDILLNAEFRDLESLNKLVKEDIPSLGGIRMIETWIVSEVKKRFQVTNKFSPMSIKPVPIDDIDDQLIRELRKDGRAPFTVLAEKYGLSTAMVSRRVASLVKKNVIQITIAPNPTRMGRPVVAYVGLYVKPHQVDIVASRLSEYSQIPQVMTLMNGYDILAVVTFKDLEVLSRFIMKEIASIEGVVNIETLVRAEFKKRTYLGFDFEKALQQMF